MGSKGTRHLNRNKHGRVGVKRYRSDQIHAIATWRRGYHQGLKDSDRTWRSTARSLLAIKSAKDIRAGLERLADGG